MAPGFVAEALLQFESLSLNRRSSVILGHIRASRSGYLKLKVSLGQLVSKGDVVAETRIRSDRGSRGCACPMGGFVAELKTWATTNVGDIVAFIPALREG